MLKLALVSERVLAVARVTTSTAMAAAVSAVVCSIASISTGGRCWRWPPHVRPAIAAPAVIAACLVWRWRIAAAAAAIVATLTTAPTRVRVPIRRLFLRRYVCGRRLVALMLGTRFRLPSSHVLLVGLFATCMIWWWFPLVLCWLRLLVHFLA